MDKAHLYSILCCYGFYASSPPLEANLGSPDATKGKVRDWNRDEHGHFVSSGIAKRFEVDLIVFVRIVQAPRRLSRLVLSTPLSQWIFVSDSLCIVTFIGK